MLCVVVGALASAIAVLHVRHGLAVLDGRAGVLEYGHLLDATRLRGPLLGGGAYAGVRGVGAYGWRRGYPPEQVVAVSAGTVAVAAAVGSWTRDPHPVFGAGDILCFSVFLGVACGGLVHVADEAVARVERRWSDRPRHQRATPSSLLGERVERSRMTVSIVYPREEYFESFHRALDVVARERVYIEMVEAPPLESVRRFQAALIARDGPVYYAVEGDQVVGWCDVFPFENPRHAHRGGLGMGCLPGHRGQGIGARLLRATLEHAKRFGLEKVELHVYTSNTAAIHLYERFGFEREGLLRSYRRLDGLTFDCLAMARFL